MSEVTKFLRQSREEDAHEAAAVALDDSHIPAPSAAQRERANPHDPPDMRAVISSLITMKHDYNE